MTDALRKKTIGFVVSNEGVEQAELTGPWDAVREVGGRPILIAPFPGKVQAFKHLDRADTFDVDRLTTEVSIDEFDGLVLPGGVANADQLRTDEHTVVFSRLLRRRAASRRHLPHAVDHHRGGAGEGADHDLVAQPSD